MYVYVYIYIYVYWELRGGTRRASTSGRTRPWRASTSARPISLSLSIYISIHAHIYVYNPLGENWMASRIPFNTKAWLIDNYVAYPKLDMLIQRNWMASRIPFGDHLVTLERYRELAWPLRNDDTHTSRSVTICSMSRAKTHRRTASLHRWMP